VVDDTVLEEERKEEEYVRANTRHKKKNKNEEGESRIQPHLWHRKVVFFLCFPETNGAVL
jgi:hypothetical protein